MLIKTKGVTLLEVLIAILIFCLAISALLISITGMADVIDIAKDKTVATNHLKNILEQVRANPFNSIIANFPAGLTDGPAGKPYQGVVGGYTLRNEHITVTYADPNADPLEIRATLTWLDKKGHPFTAGMSTFRTR